MKKYFIGTLLFLFLAFGAHAVGGFDLAICGLYGIDNFSFDSFNSEYATDLEDMGSGNAYGVSLTLDLPLKIGFGTDIRFWSETSESDEGFYVREITTDIVPLSLYLRYTLFKMPVLRLYGKVGITSYNAKFNETWMMDTGDEVSFSYSGTTVGYFGGAGVQLKLVTLIVKLEVQYNMGEISALDFIIPEEISDYVDDMETGGDIPVELDGMTLILGVGIGF